MSGPVSYKLLSVTGVGIVAVAGTLAGQDISARVAQSSPRYALSESVAGSQSTYEVRTDMESIIPALTRLNELAQLQPNWDSYDAEALTPSAIAAASLLITSVNEDRRSLTGRPAPPWVVAPVPDGGVQVEWMASPRKIVVQIDPDGELSYLVVDRSELIPSYTEDHGVPIARIRALVDSILTV
jgi:hypothetical protein